MQQAREGGSVLRILDLRHLHSLEKQANIAAEILNSLREEIADERKKLGLRAGRAKGKRVAGKR